MVGRTQQIDAGVNQGEYERELGKTKVRTLCVYPAWRTAVAAAAGFVATPAQTSVGPAAGHTVLFLSSARPLPIAISVRLLLCLQSYHHHSLIILGYSQTSLQDAAGRFNNVASQSSHHGPPSCAV